MTADKDKKPVAEGDEPPIDAAESPASDKESGTGNEPDAEPVAEAGLVSVPESDSSAEEKSGAANDPVDDPEPEPQAQQPVQPAPQVIEKKSDGFARLIAVIALAGAGVTFAMSQLPEVPQGSAARLANLEKEVGALEAPAPAPAADTSAIEAEISGLRERLAGLEARIEELSGAVATAGDSAAPAVPDLSADLAALSERVQTLEDQPERPPSINNTVGSGVSEEAVAALSQQVTGLAGQIGSLEGQVEAVRSGQSDIGASVDSRISALRSDLRAEIAKETDAVMARLNDLAASAEAAGDARRSELAERAALVLAVGRLRDAISTGKPFAGAWDAVLKLGVDPAAHDVIAAGAAEGVPTVERLRQSFPDVAGRAMVANQVGEDQSWVGGALRRVGNLVKVRRTGEVEGDSVEAVLARTEARLADGDLAAAVAEARSIQGAAATELEAWLNQAEARLALDDAVAALQTGLFDGLAKGD